LAFTLPVHGSSGFFVDHQDAIALADNFSFWAAPKVDIDVIDVKYADDNESTNYDAYQS